MTDDSDQWRTWFDRQGAALILLARQWVPGQADAEDVVQEAFIRFWKSRERVSEPVAYLFAGVKHCALDWLRSRQRQSRREELTARPEAEAWFGGGAIQHEVRAEMEVALRSLPEDQREVLVMKIWGGLSFPQVAEALSISPNTAASRYRYALAKLREQLAEESIP